MTLVLVSVGVWTLILLGLGIGVWIVRRRHLQAEARRALSPQWLNQNVYDRRGEDP